MKGLFFTFILLGGSAFAMGRGESVDRTLSSFSRRDAIMTSYLDKRYPDDKRSLEQKLAIAGAYMQLCEDKESGLAHLAAIRLFCLQKGVLSVYQNKAEEMVPAIIAELKKQISLGM